MSDILWAAAALGFGLMIGGIGGYHMGLKRANEAIWNTVQERSGNTIIAPYVRKAVINECIVTLGQVKPNGSADFNDGFRAAADVLRSIDPRINGAFRRRVSER